MGHESLNLLLVSCMVAWGVAAAGCARYIIFAIGLLPSVIYQVASVSGDAILFGLTLLFLGHLARAMQAEVIVGARLLALYVLCLALAFTKPSYVWIGWAMLACWDRPWRGVPVGRYACAAIVMISPLVVHGFLIVQGFQAAPIAPGIDAVGNWHETLEHPFKFLWMISHVIEAYPVGTRWNLWQSTIGKLGWLDAPLFMPLYPILTASLFLAAGFPGSIVSWRVRIFLLALAFGSVCCVALPIRIYAMPGPADVILGLAGRYFIPTLAVLVLACCFYLPMRTPQLARGWIIGFSIFGLVSGALAISSRYYL